VYIARTSADTGTVGTQKYPVKFPLSSFSCYPNPVTDLATLELNLTEAGRVETAVFNRNGALVLPLKNQDYPAGRHLITFDSSNLQPGAYHLRARMKNSTKTLSIIIKP
jgi:hypothetical protein